MSTLSRSEIRRLFEALNDELGRIDVTGEIYVVGGAVMCLVYNARAATRDVDALFRPSSDLRRAAVRVGEDFGLSVKWLNDAAKGFFSEEGSFDAYLELPHLKVFCAQADYLLAMKCLAMRIGREFHDESDVRFLLRYLNLESYDEAVGLITRFYPLERFPQKTLYALEEMLDDG